MAVDTYHMVRDAGHCWQKIVELWLEYLPNESWSFAWAWTTVTPGGAPAKVAVKVIVTKDDDTYNSYLMIADTYAEGDGRGRLHPAYVGSRPGFGDSPPNQPSEYGSRDTLQDYRNNVAVIKRDLVYYSSNCAVEQSDYLLGGGGKVGNAEFVTMYNVYYAPNGPWTMVQQYMAYDYEPYAPEPPMNLGTPYQYGMQGTAGGGSVDTSGIVEAIESLALVDETFSANNGASMFSIRGKIRMS